MRSNNKDPWWLTEGLSIIGFEDPDEGDEETDDEDDSEEEDSNDDDSEENEDESEDDENEDEESEDEDDEAKTKKSTAGLKSALRKERLARKKAERELRKLKPPTKKTPPKKKAKAKEGEEDEEESQSALKAAEDDRVKTLAGKLRTSAVDTAILSFGDSFKSSKELLALIDRSEIDVDQDEDDPSEIDVDLETVEEAVKALKKSSPHLLKTTRSTTKSGSKIGGNSKKKGTMSDDKLKQKYAALRR